MKRLLQWVVVALAGIIGVAFAVANRQIVAVSFDPFATTPSQQIALKAPLFIVVIIALALGVIVGSLATWLNQGKHRRALREAHGELDRLRKDVEAMKS